MTHRVGVLGHVHVAGHDAGGTATRALIAALVLAGAGHARSVAALADDLWGDEPPQNPRAALQTLVSRTRAIGGADLIESVPGGYALSTVDTDLAEARTLLHTAESTDPRQALGATEAALALWRGEPGADLGQAPIADELAQAAAAIRERLSLLRARALTAEGRTTEAVTALVELAAAHPFDEGLQQEMLTALAADGRTAEAIARYASFADGLRNELGSSPGPALIALNAQLLRAQEPQPRLRIGVRAAPNALIGREQALSAIMQMLTAARLVTVLGVGGMGKTRLAYEVAAASDEEAVVIIPLAAVRDDGDVEPAIAAALGISESSPGAGLSETLARPDLHTRILGVLGERSTLLVLDNCEQVIDGVAAWVADVLAAVPQLRILATSRTPLEIAAERVYPLQALEAEGSAAAPAVRLFIERA
ncbi:AfsR/SARP family transcriptional regulator [Microbacterium suwonense]|uniref:Bacterial transcriptional activator domain-containing protein n=1 Tax=Microbacterium suwonense TaxID=683047 RepID=A0ABN6X1K7_9MICO|nr:BTAD domain-containing putative transcriptional regulator [Microbacterium suwonense]BDZ38572.1 hypothetical protein GCM10025863_11860 [Microbacterium suwonense]